MRISSVLVALGLTLSGCGGDEDIGSNVIGTSGGTVSGDGAQVTIPAGALAQDTTITVSLATEGYPDLPTSWPGSVFRFEPHGQTFASPVTISVPAGGEGDTVNVLTAQPGGAWTAVPGAELVSGIAQISIDHFSDFTASAVTGDACQGACAPGQTCMNGVCVDSF